MTKCECNNSGEVYQEVLPCVTEVYQAVIGGPIVNKSVSEILNCDNSKENYGSVHSSSLRTLSIWQN